MYPLFRFVSQIVGAPVHTTGKVKVELVQVDSCELYPGCHLQGDVEKDSGTLPDKALRYVSENVIWVSGSVLECAIMLNFSSYCQVLQFLACIW